MYDVINVSCFFLSSPPYFFQFFLANYPLRKQISIVLLGNLSSPRIYYNINESNGTTYNFCVRYVFNLFNIIDEFRLVDLTKIITFIKKYKVNPKKLLHPLK